MRVNTRETNVALPSKPTLVEHSGKAHSTVVGGSTAGIRLLCNGSMVEEKKSPKSTNVWADRGTALHHVVEAAIREDLSDAKVLRQFTGNAIKLDDMVHTIDITDKLLREKALPALRYFDETVGNAKFQLEAKVGMYFPETMPEDECEELRALGFLEIPGAFGTGDVFFTGKVRAGGIDWKFGDGILVSAHDNNQGRFYLTCGIMNGVLPVQDEYEFHIFQPTESGDWTTWTENSVGKYTLADLVRFNNDLHDAITAETVYNAGEHCSKCNGRITCAAYQSMLTTAINTDIPGMSAQQLAQQLRLLPAYAKFISDVKAAALRNAQAGVEIPGFKLETALGNSAWRDEQAAVGALARKGVPVDVRIVKKVISPTQALKALKEIATPEKEIERFTKTHIHRPENGETLVPAKAEEEATSSIKRLGKALKARGL